MHCFIGIQYILLYGALIYWVPELNKTILNILDDHVNIKLSLNDKVPGVGICFISVISTLGFHFNSANLHISNPIKYLNQQDQGYDGLWSIARPCKKAVVIWCAWYWEVRLDYKIQLRNLLIRKSSIIFHKYQHGTLLYFRWQEILEIEHLGGNNVFWQKKNVQLWDVF